MPRATLTISLPESTWIRDLSTAHPATTFRVVAVQSADDGGVVLLEFDHENAAPIVAEVETHDDVTQCDLLWSRDGTTLLQVENTEPRLVGPLRRARVPLRTPFEIDDGQAIWELTTSRERLSALGDQLEAAGVAFELESIRPDAEATGESLLTDRQREVLLAAVAQGYYETPRQATLTEVSESLGISKATGSTVLHRAEGAILTWFVEEYLDGPASVEP